MLGRDRTIGKIYNGAFPAQRHLRSCERSCRAGLIAAITKQRRHMRGKLKDTLTPTQ